MPVPREYIELLLAKIDIVDVINIEIPLRKKSGSNYFARCPFHNEKSASFSVSQTKQFYYCFGCGAHGNAIDFMMQHDRLTFKEAIETLSRQVGMEVPETKNFAHKEDIQPSLYEVINAISLHFYENLRKSERAIHYLKERGISGAIAQAFRLGYAPNSWDDVLKSFSKTPEDTKNLLTCGLIVNKNDGGYYDRFRDRIIFPISDFRGRVIGFGGRIIDQGEPKYLNSPETILFQKGHELYGLHQAIKLNRKLDRIIVVEGYMDVIALFQHGITYAVATLGTATTKHHLKRLCRYTNEIIFCFDGDDAGRRAAWRALEVIFPYLTDHLQIRFLFLPDGEDPDTLIRKAGKESFEKEIGSALTLSAFFLQSLAKQCDLGTMEGRARLATLCIDYIKQLPDGILPDILLQELSHRVRIDLETLKQQLHSKESKGEPSRGQKILDYQAEKLAPAIKKAIALLIQHPTLITCISDDLPKSKAEGTQFLCQLIEIIKKNPNITTGLLREYFRGQKAENFIAILSAWDPMIPQDGIKSEFLGALQQVKQMELDEDINRFIAKAVNEGLTNDEKITLSDLIGKKKLLYN